MPHDTTARGEGSTNLYSLEDLRRFGPSNPNGLYTVNDLGHMFWCLTVLDGGKFFCMDCCRMGTREKTCPHGTFTANTSSAPILVRPVVLAWPADLPQAQSRADFPQVALVRDGSQHRVASGEASTLPLTALGIVTDGITQPIGDDSALAPPSPTPYALPIYPLQVERATMRSTSAAPADLPNLQTQTYSSATPSTTIAPSFGLPSPPWLPFTTVPSASSSISSPVGAGVDAQQMFPSHSAFPQQLAAHPVVQPMSQYGYYYHPAQYPACQALERRKAYARREQ
ncbi:hypothetical protein GSI_04600 [Ganoderma sinense ZZ0214-1]|uniref:Uncharacterized protein n=1 Tax=Ganoderma sinense ZZ0214-1 TaxID=1077348 RepID=A0A2G8SHA1_9APHY|nr:hypothetical protein GSI_04600 [Ganoderma sinense ZZ0214-1]